MHFLIFTGGTIRMGPAVSSVLQSADRIIAADSGAEIALSFGIFPDTILGDLDSLKKETIADLEKHHALFISSTPKKDETDTELALQFAIKQGATKVSIIGGIEGDRLDHILANIFLITHTPIPVTFVSGSTWAWVAHGPYHHIISGKKSDLLSLIPLSPQVHEIVTKNLSYPLVKESLYWGKSRGVSNIFLQTTVQITFTVGTLCIIHTTTAV